MQTRSAYPAAWRGLLLFAGKLIGKATESSRSRTALPLSGSLVSWCAGARSRREDELARIRQSEPQEEPARTE